MIKKQINDVIKLTKECVIRYWKMDCDYVIGFLDKNVNFISSRQMESGKENAAHNLRCTIQNMTSCHVLHQEFDAVQNNDSSCCVTGHYVLAAEDTTVAALQREQRCTFVWELGSGAPVIKHLHISHATIIQSPSLATPVLCSVEPAVAAPDAKIVVHDEEGVTHFLAASEVLYAEANDKRVTICTNRGKITAKMSISQLLRDLGSAFVLVHRSFLVNINHVCEVRKYCIVMSDQTCIPVPVKKFRQIKAEILRFYAGETETEIEQSVKAKAWAEG